MAPAITSMVRGDTSPNLLSAAAIEPGVGWWWRRASRLSGATGPVRAVCSSLASMRACKRSISCEQGPAYPADIDVANAAALSIGNRRMLMRWFPDRRRASTIKHDIVPACVRHASLLECEDALSILLNAETCRPVDPRPGPPGRVEAARSKFAFYDRLSQPGTGYTGWLMNWSLKISTTLPSCT